MTSSLINNFRDSEQFSHFGLRKIFLRYIQDEIAEKPQKVSKKRKLASFLSDVMTVLCLSRSARNAKAHII